MDVKSAFLYGKIEEEIYVCQPLGFKDPDFPDRMSSMGELTFFLGLQVKQKEDGIFIIQDKYVTEILKKFGFIDVKTASTPMETHKPLFKDAYGEDVDEHLYRSMIGSLMYLTSSRPNIMFAVCACARFQVNPKISHLHVVKRIFRYLKGQPKLGLWYPKDPPFDLVAFADSDFAGASLDRKSTTGCCQFLGCRLILWQCKKQTVVANSTTETEYIAASNCLKNPFFHSKTKHIEIRHHFIRDLNEKNLIQMIKIHIDQNVADLLTKAFDRIIHKGWMEWNAKAAKDGIRVKTGNSRVKAVGHYLVLLSKNETVTKEREDIMERAATTASSLEEECQYTILGDAEAQTRFETASKQSNDPPLSRFNTLGSREDKLKLKELMDLCIKLSDRVLDLETTKTAQAKEIANLKKIVKKLERKRKSKTLGMNLFNIGTSKRRSLGEEDASKQGRNLKQGKQRSIFKESDFDDEGFDADMNEVFKDVEGDAEQVISAAADEVPTGDAVNTAGTEVNTTNAPVTTAGVSVSTTKPITTASVNITTAEPTTHPTTTTIFEDEDLIIAQTLVKMRSEKSKIRGVVMQEPSKIAIRPTVPPQQHDLKDKAKLKEEERLAKQREEDANIAAWDDVQAMMDADYELAARLQAQEQGELTIKERSKLFVKLIDKKKKHFARLRAEE
ncbi:hypothetical protein Tco_1225374 [Tanacetum coccineum]